MFVGLFLATTNIYQHSWNSDRGPQSVTCHTPCKLKTFFCRFQIKINFSSIPNSHTFPVAVKSCYYVCPILPPFLYHLQILIKLFSSLLELKYCSLDVSNKSINQGKANRSNIYHVNVIMMGNEQTDGHNDQQCPQLSFVLRYYITGSTTRPVEQGYTAGSHREK